MKTSVNRFAISNHTALKLDIQAMKRYFKLTCEYELHILSYTKTTAPKDHGENYMSVRPPLLRHPLRNCLLPGVPKHANTFDWPLKRLLFNNQIFIRKHCNLDFETGFTRIGYVFTEIHQFQSCQADFNFQNFTRISGVLIFTIRVN